MVFQDNTQSSKKLSPLDLENVSGGMAEKQQLEAFCPFCNAKKKVTIYWGSRAVCSECNRPFIL